MEKNVSVNQVAVDVVDAILITEEYDTSLVLAEWAVYDPNITVYSDLTAQAVKLTIKWSDKGGTIDLAQGDFFTFVFPDIFNYDYIQNVNDIPIKNELDEIVATYSIYDNASNMKEVKITFSEYVDTHSNFSGDFWALLFVGNVSVTEQAIIEFIINDNVVAQGEVTINPGADTVTPRNYKAGFSSPTEIEGGFYVFEWTVSINMDENSESGFNVLQNFSFEDVIPPNSPHTFLTDEIRQTLGIPPTAYQSEIGEYAGADSYEPTDRYSIFFYHYNSLDTNFWYNFVNWNPLANGITSVGIDGDAGLDISNIQISDKLFVANLGRLTRPTVIRFYTIASIELTESALGDSEVVSLFKNTFIGNYGENLSADLYVYYFGSGGSAQGISGNYSFTFTKVNENDEPISNAMFSLYTSDDFLLGANRIVNSDSNGVVVFNNLPAGTYYMVESIPSFRYLPNETVYKVVITSHGYEIYYGENFENKLSDVENKIINRAQFETSAVSVTFAGTKTLIGKTLTNGMFNFLVKDQGGTVVATGVNNASGDIIFTAIKFDAPGVYTFIAEEIRGSSSGIIYDGAKFNITVIVTDEGGGVLSAEVFYPFRQIDFVNSYTPPLKRPRKCCSRVTKCRTSIEGYKIWEDNNNADDTRPESVEIILLRDGEVYERELISSGDNWIFGFCCLPIQSNSGHRYIYTIEEIAVPGYSTRIEGNNIINTLL